MNEKEILKRTHNLLVETKQQVGTLRSVVTVWFVIWLVTMIISAVASLNATSQSEAALRSLQQELNNARSVNSY